MELWSHWDTGINAWEEAHKHERTYDANNNNTLELRHHWNTNTNAWSCFDTIAGDYYAVGVCAYTLPDPGWAWGNYSGHNAYLAEMYGFTLIANTNPIYLTSSNDSTRYYYTNIGSTAIEGQSILINNKELLLSHIHI